MNFLGRGAEASAATETGVNYKQQPCTFRPTTFTSVQFSSASLPGPSSDRDNVTNVSGHCGQAPLTPGPTNSFGKTPINRTSTRGAGGVLPPFLTMLAAMTLLQLSYAVGAPSPPRCPSKFIKVGEGTLLSGQNTSFAFVQFKALHLSPLQFRSKLEAACVKFPACVGFHHLHGHKSRHAGAILFDGCRVIRGKGWSSRWPPTAQAAFGDEKISLACLTTATQVSSTGTGVPRADTASTAAGKGWKGWEAYRAVPLNTTNAKQNDDCMRCTLICPGDTNSTCLVPSTTAETTGKHAWGLTKQAMHAMNRLRRYFLLVCVCMLSGCIVAHTHIVNNMHLTRWLLL